MLLGLINIHDKLDINEKFLLSCHHQEDANAATVLIHFITSEVNTQQKNREKISPSL